VWSFDPSTPATPTPTAPDAATHPQGESHRACGQDAEQDRAPHAPRVEHRHHEQAEEEYEEVRRRETAVEFDQRAGRQEGRIAGNDRGGGHDEPRVLQADEGDEQPDPCRDAVLEAGADRVEDPLADAEEVEQVEQNARHEHHAQGYLPGICEPAAAAAGMTVNTKKKFSPCPAPARSVPAVQPMMAHATADARTWPP